MPMLEIEPDLIGKDVMFMPLLDVAPDGKVRDAIDGWISDFVKMAAKADGNGGDYIQEMLENPEIAMQFNVIDGHLKGNLARCNEFRKRYSKYRYLWTTDLAELFREFLETAWVAEGADSDDELAEQLKTAEEKAADRAQAEEDGTRRVLDLGKFDREIRKCREVQLEVADLRASADIDFIRVNSQPIKQALATWVTKWVYIYTQYLHAHVTSSLRDLDGFMETVTAGLDVGARGRHGGAHAGDDAHPRRARQDGGHAGDVLAAARDGRAAQVPASASRARSSAASRTGGRAWRPSTTSRTRR